MKRFAGWSRSGSVRGSGAKEPVALLIPAETTGERPTPAPAGVTRQSGYHPSLDGLRGLAALMVAYGHAGYFHWVPLVGGCATVGVLLFFFLSGFLMGQHYLPDGTSSVFGRDALGYWSSFLLRRFLRVYPPFLFALVLGCLLLLPRLPPDFAHTKQIDSLVLLRTLARIAVFRGPLGIYWTIEVELFFYLFYPLAVMLGLSCRRPAATLLLLFAVLTILGNRAPLPGYWAGFTSIFLAGAFTAALIGRFGSRLDAKLPSRNALCLAAFAVLLLVVAAISQSNPTQPSIWRLNPLFAGLFFVIFLSLIGSDGIVGRLLSSRAGRALGRASYSLYLVHIIAFYAVISYLGPSRYEPLAALVVLAGISALYHAVVERPFVHLSKRIIVDGRTGPFGRAGCRISDVDRAAPTHSPEGL